MANSINIESALQKARTKRDLAKLLAELSRSDQRDILVDLLAALEEPSSSIDKADRKKTPTVAAKTNDTEPTAGEDQKTNREQVVDVLRGSPGVAIKAIAMSVYGDDGERSVGRVRAILTVLKKQGRAKNTSFGKWSAKEPKT